MAKKNNRYIAYILLVMAGVIILNNVQNIVRINQLDYIAALVNIGIGIYLLVK
ncbi:hypothetical protein JXB31_01610 [Candidatus Woesearchaeota archaeon]|nr:hypothetical protein [Candidatus Woesearchaeota archaeon]